MEQSRASLHAFTSQYITSASLMADWLDDQMNKGNLGVHSALRALNQIVEDVEDRQTTLASVTSESIGISHSYSTSQTPWMREVFDLSKDKSDLGSSENQLDPRANVARCLLSCVEKVKKLKDVQTALSEKWTHGPGGGYTPSSIYSGNGDEHGVFETILGAGGDGVEGDGVFGDQEGEKEMWGDLQDLSETEENLLVKWREVAVENDKKLRAKQNFQPTGAEDSKFLVKVDPVELPVTLRYQPHPSEVAKSINNKKAKEYAEATEKKRIEDHWKKAKTVLEDKKREKAEREGKSAVGLAVEAFQEGDDTRELDKLQKLQRFRSSRRQELFDYSLNGGKYDALKMQVGGSFADDDLSEEEEDQAAIVERAQNGMSDAFAAVDAKVKSGLRTKKHKIKVAQEEETIGKFPFKLNRYTIDNRMRPVKLWKGGVNQTDVPPLVSGEDEAREVSTVALVVPTQFVGGGKVCSSHRLLKKASKDPNELFKDSPCLSRADMASNKMDSKIPSGQSFDSHSAIEPENVSDIDIRKYAHNWGPILGC
ncbi:hypothetical protein TL16_g05959 [Triparma laevis f. inornata]|uniref:Uncharacterized protein n=1 Tax=Triparma laevis f. inornata TaxID=1714386 RepID=A0A9W7ARG8_9STRA|nr:hypothetical protein TL16_g05959 [Triparma laevis f. inornata]